MSVGLEPRPDLRKTSFLPGTVLVWVHIVVAALAMVATLPGRSHGLGLVTEPLLADLHLSRVEYNKRSDGGDQREKHYEEFHRWRRGKYAEYNKTDVIFQ